MWCRYNVEEGPDERRRGREEWKDSDVMALGWMPGTSFVR
jgi:hypothetical protein